MDAKAKILWVDDEVEHLRPHILFLEQKGYDILTATNSDDALETVRNTRVDLVLLDEMMPGRGGIETLALLKEMNPVLPVVMVTKSEEESLMEDAIGGKIDDYLTKPVNPSQVLLTVKKFLEAKQIMGQKTAQDYIRDFNMVAAALMNPLEIDEWIDLYTNLVTWDLELDEHPELGLDQTMLDQRRECNHAFSKFVEKEYRNWIEEETTILSPGVVDQFLLPHLDSDKSIFFFVIDCLRLDQWLVMERHLQSLYSIEKSYYVSMLPTATPYARNAIFSGLYPSELERIFPELWSTGQDDDYSMNKYEKELLEKLLERRRIKLRNDLKYIKIIETSFGKQVEANIGSYAQNHLTVVVVNVVDMLAHGRSDYPILKEIAPDEAAYRSLTNSWFMYSSLFGMFKAIARLDNVRIVLTTDHGSVRCMRGVKVLGDRETSTNLRYKYGRNVKADSRHALRITRPEEYRLPRRGVTVNYIIAKEDYYFVYPTDYNKYLTKYRDSFQHGGISLEEMILPVVVMEPRR